MTRVKLYLWISAFLCAALFLLPGLGFLDIYREGAQQHALDPMTWIFTREIVREKLSRLSPLFLMSIGFLAAGLILGIKDEQAEEGKDPEILRDLLFQRVAAPSETMRRARRAQNRLRFLGILFAGMALLPALLYLLDGKHFESTDLEWMMGELLLHIAPWSFTALGILLLTEICRERMIRDEILEARLLLRKDTGAEEKDLLEKRYLSSRRLLSRNRAGCRLLSSHSICARPLILKCIASLCTASAQSELDSYEKRTEDGNMNLMDPSHASRASRIVEMSDISASIDSMNQVSISDTSDPSEESREADKSTEIEAASMTKGLRAARILFLILAGVLILHGVINGSMRDVLVKAVSICTECVGLG